MVGSKLRMEIVSRLLRQTRSDPRPGILLLVVVTVIVTVVLFSLRRFTDPRWVYEFADRRQILGVPNFMDVISNAPFLLIGLLGLLFVARTPAGGQDRPFAEPWERMAFGVLFGGVLTVAFGSAYFHLTPTVATLVWDRLPMTIIFMSVFGIVIAERIGLRVGRLVFFPMLAVGIGSVLHWFHADSLGRGDVRLYYLVQFFPMLALPILILLFPARYTRTSDLVAALGWYVLAKLVEYLDARIFALTGVVSGHTLKHLSAALTTICLLRMMKLRRPFVEAAPAAGCRKPPR